MLESLLSIANASGRNYGSLPVLEEQHLIFGEQVRRCERKVDGEVASCVHK